MSGEIRQWAQDMSSASSRVGPLIEAVTRKTAADIEWSAKIRAAVRTGNLRNSIGHTIETGPGSIEAEIGPTAAYGIYVEKGTSRQAPQPFMAPAYDEHQPKLQEALGSIIERSL